LNKTYQLSIESYTAYFQLQVQVANCKKYTQLAWPCPTPGMAYSKW